LKVVAHLGQQLSSHIVERDDVDRKVRRAFNELRRVFDPRDAFAREAGRVETVRTESGPRLRTPSTLAPTSPGMRLRGLTSAHGSIILPIDGAIEVSPRENTIHHDTRRAGGTTGCRGREAADAGIGACVRGNPSALGRARFRVRLFAGRAWKTGALPWNAAGNIEGRRGRPEPDVLDRASRRRRKDRMAAGAGSAPPGMRHGQTIPVFRRNH
jgi:hypothetical protein